LPSALLDALRSLPGGPELLDAASAGADAGPIHLVGGSVRDLLRGAVPRELDVVVEGEIEPLLGLLGGTRVAHERFGTAEASVDGARVDVTMSRRERYPHPGALPEVEPAPLAEDLLRRDFTVNAIALSLPQGELRAVAHAEDDLARGRLRVLHDKSFIDDPTRLWRLGRYAARLNFDPEEHTAALAGAALAAGAPDTVSGTRTGAELRLALGEDDAPAALARLQGVGVLSASGLGDRFDEPLMRAALELLPEDGRSDLLLLSALLANPTGAELRARDGEDAGGQREPALAALLDRLAFPAADRDRVVASVIALPLLVRELAACSRPSELHALAQGVPVEGIALAGALGSQLDGSLRANAERWLSELRHVRLQINGDDLIAAGVAEGPEIGRLLRMLLDRRLDGELAEGREAELRAALEAS
jgi:tRNA nucleotidyltransferase (CCA-adding enzyme)